MTANNSVLKHVVIQYGKFVIQRLKIFSSNVITRLIMIMEVTGM